MTDSRYRSGNTISKAQWQDHFEKLFKSRNVDDNEVNIDVEDDHDEIEYDITENELEDYIFNSEITNEKF